MGAHGLDLAGGEVLLLVAAACGERDDDQDRAQFLHDGSPPGAPVRRDRGVRRSAGTLTHPAKAPRRGCPGRKGVRARLRRAIARA